MPEQEDEIMYAIRENLDHLRPYPRGSNRVWTQTIVTKSCEIGRDRVSYKVCAGHVP